MSDKIVSTEIITDKIYVIRGQKVMLGHDLAQLYKVPTKSLNLAVKRNIDRFPEDFMFRITGKEAESLRFQIETSKKEAVHGGRRYLPYAFTEQGVSMLSSVLRSKQAVRVNIVIMRSFVKLRETLSLHKELAKKLKELENKVDGHDDAISAIFEALHRLMREEENPKQRIGFK